jgi:hypothetical protein
MLKRNQLRVLLPQLVGDQFKTLPKICLFGSPDPVETRTLLEEQFIKDREYMLRKYSFDIAKGRPIEKEKTQTEAVAMTGSHEARIGFLIPAATNEEVGKQCIPESEVRHRSGRYSPYNRQTRITGKSKSHVCSEYGHACTGSTVFELIYVFFPCQRLDRLKETGVFMDCLL